ncbi:MAG: hypothetical protein V4662_21610 [Verrucomicrobiota bacterium]
MDPFDVASLSFSTILALFLAYYSIRSPMVSGLKELRDELAVLRQSLGRKNAALTRQQADQVSSYYLACLQTDLSSQARFFLEHELPKIQSAHQGQEAKLFVFNKTRELIREHRGRLASLMISPGFSLEQFLDRVSPVDGTIIKRAQKEVIKLFDQAIDRTLTESQAADKILPLIANASHETRDEIKRELDKLKYDV